MKKINKTMCARKTKSGKRKMEEIKNIHGNNSIIEE